MKRFTKLLLIASAPLISFQAFAGPTIYSGTVINDSGFYSASGCDYSSFRAFDQSGLSNNYVSGTTDFDSFTALAPTHLGSSNCNTAGALDNTPAFVDLDFGMVLNFSDLALWNDNDSQGIDAFSLIVADNASFTGATSLGAFNATYGPSGYSNPVAMQLFDLTDAAGQFVRINMTSHGSLGSYVNFGEFVFAAESSVPEPTSLMLLALGLLGHRLTRRQPASM